MFCALSHKNIFLLIFNLLQFCSDTSEWHTVRRKPHKKNKKFNALVNYIQFVQSANLQTLSEVEHMRIVHLF